MSRVAEPEFVVETPDGELEFPSTGPAATYLLDGGHANADREPHWHLRWCLDRMDVGEVMEVGDAIVHRVASRN